MVRVHHYFYRWVVGNSRIQGNSPQRMVERGLLYNDQLIVGMMIYFKYIPDNQT